MDDAERPIPAATLIVMREGGAGEPELLMVERAAAMRFAGGALVFPGGRIDPGDRALAELHGGDLEDMAGRVAAIRETLEEAGLPVGLSLSPEHVEPVRRAVYSGEPFGELVRKAGGTIRPEALIPFARWLPHGVVHRVFDTRFYLARAPAEAPEPRVDGNENVRVFWASARAVLEAADAGRATIIFPTRRNLERLAAFASFEEAAAHARAHPIRTITPWVERRDNAEHLCIPEDLGYPVTSERLDRAARG